LKTTDQFRSIPDEDLFKYDVGQRHQTFLNQPDIRPFALTVADLSWSPGWVDDDSAEGRKDRARKERIVRGVEGALAIMARAQQATDVRYPITEYVRRILTWYTNVRTITDLFPNSSLTSTHLAKMVMPEMKNRSELFFSQ
jgi:hypothetical protein